HFPPERHVSREYQQARDECGPEDARFQSFERHFSAPSSRCTISSYKPNKSFACSEPPIVSGMTMAGICVRSAKNSDGRESLYGVRKIIFTGCCFTILSTSARCVLVGSTPGFGSRRARSRSPNQFSRYVNAM